MSQARNRRAQEHPRRLFRPERFPEQSARDTAISSRIFVFPASAVQAELCPGSYLANRTGHRFFRVLRRDVVWTSGDHPSKRRVRVACAPIPRTEIPPSAEIAPWPVPGPTEGRQGPRIPPAQSEAAGDASLARFDRIRVKAPALFALSDELAPVRAAAEERRREAAARKSRAPGPKQEAREGPQIVQPVRVEVIRDPKGQEIRGPTLMRGEWRDPADSDTRRRSPRVVAGWRRNDPLVRLSKGEGRLVTKDHIKAADQYRLTWECGYGGARPGYVRPEIPARYYGPVTGPPGDLGAAIRRFDNARRFASLGRPALLDEVVIAGRDVSNWAAAHGINRQIATGILIAQLTLLAEFFDSDIREAESADEILEDEAIA